MAAAAPVSIDKVARPELAQHESSILDLVFVMDCTGSMGSYIASATANIRSIVEEIVVSEKCDVRLALVEYRDHPPQDATFVTRVHDFTARVSEMKGWLGECQAAGGGDGPEAVADGLHAVLKLSWRTESTKICVLISDAPPHGLNPSGDGFPNGCPCGIDPVKTVREMAEKRITLYAVGVEPSIVPYRDFFMSLAYTTGGQYVPMVNSKLLAKVIIGGVREEISLDRLMEAAQADIAQEMARADAEGADEAEKVKRINKVFASKNLKAKKMDNAAGTASYAAKQYASECSDMSAMQSAWIAKSSAPTAAPTAAAAPSFLASAASAVTSTFGFLSKSSSAAPPPPPPAAAPMPTAEMTYALKEEEDVDEEQAERVYQKWQNWKK